MASARTLADISDERVVPVDYLFALIMLFLLMVLDRLVYSRGNCFGKAWAPNASGLMPMHNVQQAELFSTCSSAITFDFTSLEMCHSRNRVCRSAMHARHAYKCC